MSKNKAMSEYPSYDDVLNVPRQTKLWPPFQPNSKISSAEARIANAGVLISFLALILTAAASYAGALWLTDLCRDALIAMLPGAAPVAGLVGTALKTLATMALAWSVKMCWTCIPFVMTRLREEADEGL